MIAWKLILDYILIMIKFALKHYYSQSLAINSYLLDNLQRRGLLPLKRFQLESLEHINDGFNFFLNSCTGSGKTLSYLVPMLNKILLNKSSKIDENCPQGGIILTLNK